MISYKLSDKSCRSQSGPLFLGHFSIKAYKTSEPEKKLVSHLGMIAGGTGEWLLGLHPRGGGAPRPFSLWSHLT